MALRIFAQMYFVHFTAGVPVMDFSSVDDIPRAVVPVFYAKSMVVYFRQLLPLGLASGLAVDLMFLLVWIFYTLDQRALITSYLGLSVAYALIFMAGSLG